MIKKLIWVVALLVSGAAQAFAPQSGTWVVSSELNGKPGRGLSIDVQKDTFLMQMYAYESSGQPTFYLAVGNLVNNQLQAPLYRYVGGRFFGSGDRSGAYDSSPGQMSIRFTSGITGYVTFPGEPEVAIQRFNFAYPFARESLVGYWTFTNIGSLGVGLDLVNLNQFYDATSTGNGIVASPNGLFGCEHQIAGNLAGTVLCVKLNSSGQLLASYWFVYSVNEGEGNYQLGSNANLQLLMVRRITTPAGAGTGLVFRADEEAVLDGSHLARHLEQLAREARPLD